MVQKITYYIKHIWNQITLKRLVVIGIVAMIGVLSLFSFPYIYTYVTTPKPPPLRASSVNSKYLYNASSNVGKVKGSFSAYIGESKTNTPKVEVNFGELTTASFVMTKLNSDLKKPEKVGNKLVFSNVRNQVDLSYELLSNGVKEEIIVKAPIEGNAFTFDLNSQGALPKKDINGALSPFFYNTSGAYVFHLAKPYAYDKKGERTDNVAYKIKKTGTDAEYQVTVIVDEKWLLDPKRVYPVAIDPTIVHDTTAEFSTGQLNRVIDTGSGSSPNLTTNYQELPADINTVGLWHLNEASGNALDSSGNSNTGTPTGTTVVSGKLGNARSFNGSGEYINLASTPIAGTGSFSIFAWIKTSTTGTRKQIISFGSDTTNQGEWFFINTNNQVASDLSNTGGPTSTATVTDGNWHYVGVVNSSNTFQIYVDGVASGTPVSMSPNINTGNTPVMGSGMGANSGNWRFAGII